MRTAITTAAWGASILLLAVGLAAIASPLLIDGGFLGWMFPGRRSDPFFHSANVLFSVIYGSVVLIGGLLLAVATVFWRYLARLPNS